MLLNANIEIPINAAVAANVLSDGAIAYADAAQILDVPIGTIMSRLHRGRRALKQKLAEETMA